VRFAAPWWYEEPNRRESQARVFFFRPLTSKNFPCFRKDVHDCRSETNSLPEFLGQFADDDILLMFSSSPRYRVKTTLRAKIAETISWP